MLIVPVKFKEAEFVKANNNVLVLVPIETFCVPVPLKVTVLAVEPPVSVIVPLLVTSPAILNLPPVPVLPVKLKSKVAPVPIVVLPAIASNGVPEVVAKITFVLLLCT